MDKNSRCVYAVMFHSTGDDFEASVELFSSLASAAQYVARDAFRLMDVFGIPTDTPCDKIAKHVKSRKRFVVTIRGASNIWRIVEKKVDSEC